MYIGIGPSGLGCCLATLLIAVLLCLPAAAFGQSSHGRVSPAAAKAAAAKADADLLAEFKAGAAVGKRTEAELQADAAHVVDLLLRALADAGKSRYRSAQARSDLGRVCRNSLKADDDRVRQAVMKALAETLSRDANSPPEIQATVAQYLQDYGAAECVEPLAGMLAAGDTDRRELARMTLETINVPAAGEKLRSAMFSAVDPNWQIALMNSLGAQGGNASVRWIARMMKVPNASVVAAAAAALGDIGTADAVAVLGESRLLATGKLRLAICDAMLACAEKSAAAGDAQAAVTIWRKLYENPTEPAVVRVAALRAMVHAQGEKAIGVVVGLLAGSDKQIRPMAMTLAREMSGQAATKAFIDLLGRTADEPGRIELIALLGARGDQTARDAIIAVLKGQRWRDGASAELRKAVIAALGGVGNESDAMMLVRLAVQAGETASAERDLARASLLRLAGDKVNEALIEGLSEQDPAVRREVIRALSGRGAVEATSSLLALQADPDDKVRYSALYALANVGDEGALSGLIKWFCRAASSSEAAAAQRAMVSVCQRTQAQDVVAASIAQAFGEANVKAKCALMESCGTLASPKALETLVLGVSDPNEVVQEAALKAMANSPQPGAGDQLLHVARTADRKDRKALALSGYLRLSYYLPLPNEKKIWAYVQIMELADTPEQRKQAVKFLGEIRSAGALSMAAANIENPELAAEAETAACRIGIRLYATNPQEVVEAMDRVTSHTVSEERLKEARHIKELAQAVLDKQKK